jgi:nucleoside 2-deoxyribosyltransferase
MKRVFLAASFSQQLDSVEGKVTRDFKRAIEALVELLRRHDFEVVCSAETLGWRWDETPLEMSVAKDLQAIKDADVLLALIADKPSAGVQFEIGYAVAQQKQVVLAATTGHTLAHFDQGAVSAGLMTYVAYDTAESLVDHLVVALNALPEEL